MVAPYQLREQLIALLDHEIKLAKAGKKTKVILKMNSLEDHRLIDKLYEASQSGVEIDLIVRRVCCLVPKVKGLSDNIRVISIVDRFLEHARVFWFHNAGKPKVYLSSADWMVRNMSRRIEVVFPVYDRDNIRTLKDLLDIQLSDNTKARRIGRTQRNAYATGGKVPRRTQTDSYTYLQNALRAARK
jgi:polyphosphate kinase